MTRSIVRTFLLALAVAGPARAQSAAPPAPADLIVTAQHIYTVDPNRPVVRAFAVRDGRIVFAGSEREAMALKGPRTRVLALGDRTVIPGITDAHLHLVGVGTALRAVDLTGTLSYEEVIQRVAARARELKAGEWKKIQAGIKEIEEGRCASFEEIKRDFARRKLAHKQNRQ